MDNELRQFKTTSGEEIVCEVMQWTEGYDSEILIRKAMKLVLHESEEGVKYYSFRPWMVYQEHPEDIIVLNINNIVGIGFPPETLLAQYHEAVEEMAAMSAARESEYNKSFEEKVRQIAKRQKRHAKGDKIDEMLQRMDSSGSNVIDMFDPKKVH